MSEPDKAKKDFSCRYCERRGVILLFGVQVCPKHARMMFHDDDAPTAPESTDATNGGGDE